MARLLLTRQVTLPDPVKVERFTRAPDLGPRILFFSGERPCATPPPTLRGTPTTRCT